MEPNPDASMSNENSEISQDQQIEVKVDSNDDEAQTIGQEMQAISEPSPTPVPADTTSPTPPATHTPHTKKKLIILLVLAAIVLFSGGVGASYLLFNSNNMADTPTVTFTETTESELPDLSTPEDKLAANPAYANSIFNQQSTEVWYADRQEISRPAFFSPPGEYEENKKFYLVGERDGKKIFMVGFFELGDWFDLYEADSAEATTATKMLNFDNRYNPEYENETSLDNDSISRDTTTIYDSLTFPTDAYTLDNGFEVTVSGYGVRILETGGEWGTTVDEYLEDAIQIQSTKNGAFYELVSTLEYQDPPIELESVSFVYVTPIDTVSYLRYKPYESMKVKDFTFTRGTTTEGDSEYAEYAPITRGCGFGQYYTRYPKLVDADLTQVGTDSTGKAVYGLVDLDYKILTKYVEEYQTFTSQTITKQELFDNNALIFVKNVRGEWEIYGSPKYTQFGGCAKPVVYLYPEETTVVNVEVGADVKVSDPFYEVNGWQDVIADPLGNLTYRGNAYDSLFWEGPGIGEYPAIESGTIVKTADAMKTIREQMAYMGFNEKEIFDFTEYWHDKLPAKPYTRLTWLQNKEMQTLAPLLITPQPDTYLRAFLDFEGIERPYNLPKQSLQRVERKGFTVTEWGGLTPYKIY